MYIAGNICKITEFLIDTIFMQFGGCLDLSLYSYQNECLTMCPQETFDLIVFNNKKFLEYLKEIYPFQLTVKRKLTNQIIWQTTLISYSSWTVEVSFQPGKQT